MEGKGNRSEKMKGLGHSKWYLEEIREGDGCMYVWIGFFLFGFFVLDIPIYPYSEMSRGNEEKREKTCPRLS